MSIADRDESVIMVCPMCDCKWAFNGSVWEPTCDCCIICDSYNRLHGERKCTPFIPIRKVL